MIRLTIDGKIIESAEGRTILQIAEENGISIPTLCYHKNLLPITSCRLCVVEITGYDKPVTSCDTIALDGFVVTTRSEKLTALRQQYLKFLLIHHPLDCPVCDAAGECRLQDLCFEHKIEKVDITAEKDTRNEAPFSTALIRHIPERCVLCLRCVHACREISGRGVLGLVDTGIDAHMDIVNGTNCISCGECLNVCPVGALTERLSPLKSRHWQTKRTVTTCPHCGFGCSIIADVYDNNVITKILTDSEAIPNRGSLCVMGRFGYDFANHEKRLSAPSIKEDNVERSTDLTEAVEIIAARLTRLAKEGKRAAIVASPRATNEEMNMLLQIAGCFPMSVIGSQARYHTGIVLDHLKRAGIPYPYNYDNLIDCDLVIVAGADLLANNHLLADKVRESVKKTGCHIAVIDPSPASLAPISDVWIRPLPGTDSILFNAVAKRLRDDRKSNETALQFEGYNEYDKALTSTDISSALQACRIDEAAFDKFYGLLTKAKKIAFIFGSGISSHPDSLASLINLSLLSGINKTGILMPTALQANAVGAVSILANSVAPHTIITDPSIGGVLFYEDDPFHYLNSDTITLGLKQKSFIAVCESLPTEVSQLATVTVPTGTFAEKKGTFIAEDGYLRSVNPVRSSNDSGFEFLRLLLNKLCGGLYQREDEAFAGLLKKGVLAGSENGRDCLFWPVTANRFLLPEISHKKDENGSYTLVFRNTFFSHHLADNNVYAKLVYLDNPAVAGDKLFISPEDGKSLNISDGDKVVVESPTGSFTHKVSIKEGLKEGVIEYRLLRRRKEALQLAENGAKHIRVTLKKG